MDMPRISQFWAIRDNWSARVEVTQFERRYEKKRGISLAEQRRKWALKGEEYLRTRQSVLKYSQNGVTIATDPRINAKCIELIDDIAIQLSSEMDEKIGLAMGIAFGAWPVSSGFSKSTLFVSVEPAGTSFILRVGVTAPYALLIKGGPVRTLITKPVELATVAAIEATLQKVGK